MVSVGIGNTIFREEINAIASTPEDVFIFQTFNELFNFNELHVHLCEGLYIFNNYIALLLFTTKQRSEATAEN